jgi:16S rRNA (adenine1518-N6/adenine1519-N6)-dimethyltransferase
LGRRFGQHFLTRKSILDKIAEAACGERVPLVLEIGAGKGALTEALLVRADQVVAIEVDPVLIHYLQQKFREPIDSGRLVLVETDVLKADLGAWGRCSIAGNLPYYITSPILERVFAATSLWDRAVFLVQSEVAHRLASAPGSRDYGYLTVFAQVQANVELLFEVPRAAFHPPPKVDSAVVRLEPRIAPVDMAAFLKFASQCFRQKRKTLRNNLAPYYGKAGLDSMPEGKLRAEQMSIEDLTRLQVKLAGSG